MEFFWNTYKVKNACIKLGDFLENERKDNLYIGISLLIKINTLRYTLYNQGVLKNVR